MTIVFPLARPAFMGMPFPCKDVYGNGVPTRSRPTTPLHSRIHLQSADIQLSCSQFNIYTVSQNKIPKQSFCVTLAICRQTLIILSVVHSGPEINDCSSLLLCLRAERCLISVITHPRYQKCDSWIHLLCTVNKYVNHKR